MSRKKIKGKDAPERILAAILQIKSDQIMSIRNNVTYYNGLFWCNMYKAQYEEILDKPLTEIATLAYAKSVQKVISDTCNSAAQARQEELLKKRKEEELRRIREREVMVAKFKKEQEELNQKQQKEFKAAGFDGLML